MKQGWTARRPLGSVSSVEPRTMNVFHVSGSLAAVVALCSQSVNKLHYIWNLFYMTGHRMELLRVPLFFYLFYMQEWTRSSMKMCGQSYINFE